MNGLTGRSICSESELSRADFVIEERRESLLKTGGDNLIHRISEGNGTIIREISSVSLSFLNDHDYKSLGYKRKTMIQMIKEKKIKNLGRTFE